MARAGCRRCVAQGWACSPLHDIAHLPADMVEEFNVYRRTAVADTLLYPYYILRDSLLGDLVSTAAAQIPDALQGRDEVRRTI